MFDELRANAYCKDDISLIENYEQAKNDDSEVWVCHHRDGVKILPSGIKVYRTREELKENGRYFHCPANELIFLKPKDHSELHSKGKPRSEETKKKISNTLTGRKQPWNCKPKSEETKKKISESQKGKIPWNKGITKNRYKKEDR